MEVELLQINHVGKTDWVEKRFDYLTILDLFFIFEQFSTIIKLKRSLCKMILAIKVWCYYRYMVVIYTTLKIDKWWI